MLPIMAAAAPSILSSFSTLLWGAAGAAVLLLAGCGGEEGPPLDPDGGIAPLDPPDEEDITPPDTPRNNFAACFSPEESFQLMVDGRGAFFADSDPQDACGVMHVDRESICLAGEDCDPDGLLGNADGDTLRFIGMARWGDSAPIELYTDSPGDPGYGLMATRAQARADASPLYELRGMALPPSTSWGDIYPDFASSLGFAWPIEGELNLTNCDLSLTIYGTVQTIDGFTEPMDQVALPMYSTRTDMLSCVAEQNYSNEVVTLFEGPINVTFPGGELETTVTVCDANFPCEDVDGEENPEELTMTLIHEEPASSEEVEDNDTGDDDDSANDDEDTDGGIPPLDPPPDEGD